jgi:hypothetical protein
VVHLFYRHSRIVKSANFMRHVWKRIFRLESSIKNLPCLLQVLAQAIPLLSRHCLVCEQVWLLFDYSGTDRPEWHIPLDLCTGAM